MSLVVVQPSTTMRLNDVADAGAQRLAAASSGSAAASVVSTASIVAMFGASIAAPLAMPPMTQPSPVTTTCFGDGVGRHDGPGRRWPARSSPSAPGRARGCRAARAPGRAGCR